MENDLNAITLSEINGKGEIVPYIKPETDQSKILAGFIKIAEYMYITDNRELLDRDELASAGISHVVVRNLRPLF